MAAVVSIGKLGGGPGSERYYTDAVARGQEDYYSGEGEADGEWVGTGAGQLGLQGRVDADDFSALLRGTAPSGARLRREPDARSVIGFDLTFSAPKSVSVLYGIGNPDVSQAAREAHDEAVGQALGYLERNACHARRGHGGNERVDGDGLVVAAFRHRSSRAGDPQLHTHAVVANLTQSGGRWSTLDGRSIYAHARTAGFLYQAALRAEMSNRLGVQWGPVRRGVADMRGIDEEVLRHFSRRSQEIRERMAQRGERSARAAEVAALETRRRKNYDVPVDRLREEWRARAAEHGFGREELTQVVDRISAERRHAPPLDASFLDSHDGVTRHASTFDRRDVLREWAEAHRDGAHVRELERLADEWLRSPSAVPLDGARFSTPDMLATERALMRAGDQRRGEGAGVAAVEHVEQALAARPELADEQAAVVRGLTGSGDGVQVVRAPAGTGKTYALEAARDAWEASGYRVVGCALSARAAVELESQAGIDSTTIARLKLDLDRGYGLASHNVLVVDEAGMVGTRALQDLSANADAVGAKLVLVGDDRQLPEIDAGGAFRGLAERLGALELHETRRQQHSWDRDALASLRTGDLDAWAARYRESGRLVARPTARMVREELVADWWHAAHRDDLDAVMIAHRRVDVAELNDRARAVMAAEGRLGEEELDVGGRCFARGDRVLAKHNDRRAGIVNGARGEVLEVDAGRRAVTVALRTGEHVVLDADYLEHGHLDHGYAVTAHAAQGATVDRAFVLGSDDLYREWGYTAMTRHREEARFYLVSPGSTERALPGLEPEPDPLLEDLAEMLGESRQKSLAIDVAGNDPQVDVLADYRAISAHAAREARQVTAAEAARDAAAVRVTELNAERAELGWLERQRRAELDREIAANDAAREHWAAQVERVGETAAAASHRRQEWVAENERALRQALVEEHLLRGGVSIERENALRDALANRDLPEPLGGRPLELAGRDDWATRAVSAAEYDMDGIDLPPGPEVPDLDFGP